MDTLVNSFESTELQNSQNNSYNALQLENK